MPGGTFSTQLRNPQRCNPQPCSPLRYRKPRLERFGSIAELTAGGSGGPPEGAGASTYGGSIASMSGAGRGGGGMNPNARQRP